jgi:hypothetical protein
MVENNNRFDQFTHDTLNEKQERKWVGKVGKMTACIMGKYGNIQSMRRMSIQGRPQKDISH